jgi:hypothetical protein
MRNLLLPFMALAGIGFRIQAQAAIPEPVARTRGLRYPT